MSEEKEPIINGIDISEYFTNHYDNEGKLYAVEYKGNPLELQNAIKRLQEENEELKARLKTLDDEVLTIEITLDEFERYKKYKQALEEIRDILCNGRTFYEGYFDNSNLSRTDEAIKVINEVLNES